MTCCDRLEHDDAGGDVERAGRLVAEQHFGPLGDRAGDRDALLLAAGELRREVVDARRSSSTSPSASSGVIGFVGDLGDERDVLARRQAGDEIVELEDEADVLAAVARSARFVGRRQVVVAVEDLAAVGTSRPPRMLSSVDLPAAGRAEQHDELALVEFQLHLRSA